MESKAESKIECPKCGMPIDVNKVLLEKVRTEIGQEYETRRSKALLAKQNAVSGEGHRQLSKR